MAIDDRPYYRDSDGPPMSRLLWPFAGTLAVGEWSGVRVRLHASVVLAVVLIPLLMGSTLGVSSAVLLSVAILVSSAVHEAGHWVTSRSLGMFRREVLVAPLGNPASAEASEPPRVAAWSALGGPLANAMVCFGAGGLLWVLAPASMPWDPIGPHVINRSMRLNFGELALWWLFVVSYALLLINLLPIYPLDGGHVLHAALRPRYGFIKGLRFVCVIGMFGCVVLIIAAVLSRHPLLLVVAIGCAVSCVGQVRASRYASDEASDGIDYSAAYEQSTVPPRRRVSRRVIRKARRAVLELRQEQERLDAILAKLSKSSLASLTWQERRVLRKATERRRRQDSEAG